MLAHELTHALQDQKVDLTKWSDVSINTTAKNVEEDNRHLQVDEAETARSAVAEGQAMVTFIDYTLRPLGEDTGGCSGAGGQAERVGGGHQRIADIGKGSAVTAGVAAVSLQRGIEL